MKEKGILIVVSGFSGAGKGTIMKELLKSMRKRMPSLSLRRPGRQGRGSRKAGSISSAR